MRVAVYHLFNYGVSLVSYPCVQTRMHISVSLYLDQVIIALKYVFSITTRKKCVLIYQNHLVYACMVGLKVFFHYLSHNRQFLNFQAQFLLKI